MKILINPTPEESGNGLTSIASWNNPDTIQAINQLFCIKDNEQIDQLEVDNWGLTARISTRQAAC